MKKKLLFIIPVFLISIFSKATIINVPANYPTIQAAIFAAIDGDTV